MTAADKEALADLRLYLARLGVIGAAGLAQLDGLKTGRERRAPAALRAVEELIHPCQGRDADHARRLLAELLRPGPAVATRHLAQLKAAIGLTDSPEDAEPPPPVERVACVAETGPLGLGEVVEVVDAEVVDDEA